MWIKGTILIIFALIIDALQALISLGISVIAAFPGTVGGAVGGCVAAQQVVSGSVSCAVGGFILGALGSIPFINGALATVTIPLGILFGFVVDVSLSLTMGSALIFALYLCGMFNWGYVTAVFVGEAIPGLDVLPGWTFLVVRSILKKAGEESGGIVGLASGIASAALSPNSSTGMMGGIARNISSIKSDTGEMARGSSLVNKVYNSGPVQHIANQRGQLSREIAGTDKTDLPYVKSPSIQNDIIARPQSNTQPHAQTA